MDPFVIEWLNLLARWGHMIAGIAWIGTSFYFVALDFSLKKPAGLPQGVSGEAWEVHGGGFYNVRKYLSARNSVLYAKRHARVWQMIVMACAILATLPFQLARRRLPSPRFSPIFRSIRPRSKANCSRRPEPRSLRLFAPNSANCLK